MVGLTLTFLLTIDLNYVKIDLSTQQELSLTVIKTT